MCSGDFPCYSGGTFLFGCNMLGGVAKSGWAHPAGWAARARVYQPLVPGVVFLPTTASLCNKQHHTSRKRRSALQAAADCLGNKLFQTTCTSSQPDNKKTRTNPRTEILHHLKATGLSASTSAQLSKQTSAVRNQRVAPELYNPCGGFFCQTTKNILPKISNSSI